ncbi:MAG: hypothetical protein DHS20C21_05240 [Gemmatimonadota bacterium]|nr:MAG: hypothetical protein DHS20C21_05240 [Gemmatimonadota bacterium]
MQDTRERPDAGLREDPVERNGRRDWESTAIPSQQVSKGLNESRLPVPLPDCVSTGVFRDQRAESRAHEGSSGNARQGSDVARHT